MQARNCAGGDQALGKGSAARSALAAKVPPNGHAVPLVAAPAPQLTLSAHAELSAQALARQAQRLGHVVGGALPKAESPVAIGVSQCKLGIPEALPLGRVLQRLCTRAGVDRQVGIGQLSSSGAVQAQQAEARLLHACRCCCSSC